MKEEELIEKALRDRLQEFIGKAHEPIQIRAAVLEQLENLSVLKGVSTVPTKEELQALSDIMVVGFLGMPEDFNPKKILAGISDHILDHLADCLISAQFPTSLLTLEWMKRKGNIIDWEFSRVDSQSANVKITPKASLNYIKLDLAVEAEDN